MDLRVESREKSKLGIVEEEIFHWHWQPAKGGKVWQKDFSVSWNEKETSNLNPSTRKFTSILFNTVETITYVFEIILSYSSLHFFFLTNSEKGKTLNGSWGSLIFFTHTHWMNTLSIRLSIRINFLNIFSDGISTEGYKKNMKDKIEYYVTWNENEIDP